jgi:hypothetical protein
VTYIALWVRAFLLTVAVELAVATPLLPRQEKIKRRLGAVVFANVASHPAVWFILPELFPSHLTMLIGVEAWAFASEVLIYKLVFEKLEWRRAVAVSALANGASVLAGIALRALGVPL